MLVDRVHLYWGMPGSRVPACLSGLRVMGLRLAFTQPLPRCLPGCKSRALPPPPLLWRPRLCIDYRTEAVDALHLPWTLTGVLRPSEVMFLGPCLLWAVGDLGSGCAVLMCRAHTLCIWRGCLLPIYFPLLSPVSAMPFLFVLPSVCIDFFWPRSRVGQVEGV